MSILELVFNFALGMTQFRFFTFKHCAAQGHCFYRHDLSFADYQISDLNFFRGQPGGGETLDGGDGSRRSPGAQVWNHLKIRENIQKKESWQMNKWNERSSDNRTDVLRGASVQDREKCSQTLIFWIFWIFCAARHWILILNILKYFPSKNFPFQIPPTVFHPRGKQADQIVSSPLSFISCWVNDARKACRGRT